MGQPFDIISDSRNHGGFEASRSFRMFRLLCIITVAVTVLAPVRLTAQFLPVSLGGSSHFNRQLDAMRWQYDGNFSLTEGDFSLQLDNVFRSRLYVSDGTAHNIQDENQLQLNLRQWLSETWAVAGEAQSYSFTTTNLRQNTGHAGALYNPHEELEFSLMGGYMSDRRSNRMDQGISGLFRAQSRPIHTGDFIFHPAAEARYARISPREYSNFRFHTGSIYRFDEFQIQADLSLSSGKRESYQPGSFFNRGLTNIIESIRNDTTAFDLQINLPVTRSVGLTFDLYTLNSTRIVESRPIEDEPDDPLFDTRTQRNEIHLQSETDYEFRRSRLAAGLNYSYINRGSRLINIGDFPEDQIIRRNEILRNSNFEQSRLEVYTQNRIRVSEDHELNIRAQSGIMRYDTPDMNHDDRDELNYLVHLMSRHFLSPHFDLTVRAGGEATHFVYLTAARSIENNWRRTIRLAPQMRWRPHSRLDIQNSFTIRANYTVEDYQLEERPKNDQSSREYAMRSDIAFTLSDNWRIETGGSRSELRIGRLHWDTFQETPTDTLITYDIQAMIVRLSGNHRIGLGGRYFLRLDYLPQATITTEIETDEGMQNVSSVLSPGLQTTRQLGPSIDIDLGFISGNRLIISGWLQRQQVYRRLYTTYPEHLEDAFRREERRPARRTYPNLEIRAIFDF